MSIFDALELQAEAIGAKAGLSPDQVKAISAKLQAELGDGSTQVAAIEAVAAEHGIPVDKIQEVLSHAGETGGLSGQVGSLLGNFFKA